MTFYVIRHDLLWNGELGGTRRLHAFAKQAELRTFLTEELRQAARSGSQVGWRPPFFWIKDQSAQQALRLSGDPAVDVVIDICDDLGITLGDPKQ